MLMSLQGAELGYIALRVEREPSDQTDLKDSLDAILGGGRESFWKLIGRDHCGGPGGTMVGPTSPTWQPLGFHHGVVSSGVLWNLMD
jgi:hypothetical protein